MKDLDFDELDRAVNSLITSIPGSGSDNNVSATPDAAPVTQDQPTPVEPSTQASNSEQPVVNSLPTIPVVASVPTVERPSTGRFMDVVRPSSDMRSSLVMPERTSNQTISPLSNNLPMAPDDNNLPAEIEKPAEPIQQNTPWPDPIDFSNSSSNDSTAPVDKEEDDIDRISNDIANTLDQSQKPVEPLESPFLSGAKIEKRPLGAFSDTPLTTTIQTANSSTSMAATQPNDSTAEPTTADVSATDTPLPAELQDDLLSIESDSTTTTAPQPEQPVIQDAVTSQSTTVVNSFSTPSAVPTTTPMPAPTLTSTTAPTATTVPIPASAPVTASITPQYKEQPSTGDQNNGAIYDTKAYHKAVTPAKKKSGLMWALWIAIFLVIGAAAGAAVYFFVLPRL